MPVYYISILRARQSFDPCAFALCSSSRLSPIFCPLLLPPICRNAFARVLPLALPFPYFLPSFVGAEMSQRFCSRFTFCSAFPLSPVCFLSPPYAKVLSFALRLCLLLSIVRFPRCNLRRVHATVRLTMAAAHAINYPYTRLIRLYRGICRPHSVRKPSTSLYAARIAVKSRQRRCVCRADCG